MDTTRVRNCAYISLHAGIDKLLIVDVLNVTGLRTQNIFMYIYLNSRINPTHPLFIYKYNEHQLFTISPISKYFDIFYSKHLHIISPLIRIVRNTHGFIGCQNLALSFNPCVSVVNPSIDILL